MNGLVGEDEAREIFGIDLAVAMADEFQDDIIDAGKSTPGSRGEAWKFAAVARRQVGTGQFDLLLDQMIIVEEPLAGGGDAVAMADAFSNDFVTAVDFLGALAKLYEKFFGFAYDFDLVVASEDLGIIFELRDTEEFGAHGHVIAAGAVGTG